MKYRIYIIILVSIIILIALKFLFFPNDKKKNLSSHIKNPASIKAYVVKSFSLNNDVNIPATVLAYEEVLLRPEISGKIIQMNIIEGTHVNKGDLLIKIYDADLQAQLLKLKAQLKLYMNNEKRLRDLLAIKGVSQEQYDQAESQVEQTQADIQLLEAQISKTEIRAPISGIISLKNINHGNYVTPNDIIATIENTDLIKVDFDIPEKYADKIKKGDTIYFSTEYTPKPLKANVYAINNKIDENIRTLKVRALFNNQQHQIIPGSYVNVNLKLSSQNSGIVPLTAIISDIRGNKVYAIKNNQIKVIPVKTGLQNDTIVEIKNGLNTGDTVVYEGVMNVRPGDPFKIIYIK